MDKKITILITVLAVVIVFLIGLSSYLFLELKAMKANQSLISRQPTLAEVKAGEIGEIWSQNEESGEKIPFISSNMPLSIFSVSGIIKEIKTDELIVRDDGNNFADQSPRDLIIKINPNSLIFIGENQFLGKEGLNYLEIGINVLISSKENIRGKTNFDLKNLKIF